jgi:hypothetical protein
MATDHSTVEYRDIPGYPGYRVGSDGSVWSAWKCVSRGQSKGTMRVIGPTWQKMRPRLDPAGYPRVTIIHVGKVRVHVLILTAFVGPRPVGMYACHNDGNPANNTPGNLRWGTPQSNTLDRDHHGTHNKGERNGMHRLTEDDVREIRRRYVAALRGMKRVPSGTHPRTAAEFGVTPRYLQQVVNREVWKHVV